MKTIEQVVADLIAGLRSGEIVLDKPEPQPPETLADRLEMIEDWAYKLKYEAVLATVAKALGVLESHSACTCTEFGDYVCGRGPGYRNSEKRNDYGISYREGQGIRPGTTEKAPGEQTEADRQLQFVRGLPHVLLLL